MSYKSRLPHTTHWGTTIIIQAINKITQGIHHPSYQVLLLVDTFAFTNN